MVIKFNATLLATNKSNQKLLEKYFLFPLFFNNGLDCSRLSYRKTVAVSSKEIQQVRLKINVREFWLAVLSKTV